MNRCVYARPRPGRIATCVCLDHPLTPYPLPNLHREERRDRIMEGEQQRREKVWILLCHFFFLCRSLWFGLVFFSSIFFCIHVEVARDEREREGESICVHLRVKGLGEGDKGEEEEEEEKPIGGGRRRITYWARVEAKLSWLVDYLGERPDLRGLAGWVAPGRQQGT